MQNDNSLLEKFKKRLLKKIKRYLTRYILKEIKE